MATNASQTPSDGAIDARRLLDRLEPVRKEKTYLEARLIDPAVLSDQRELKKISYRHRKGQEILDAGDRLESVIKEIETAEEMIATEDDAEFVETLKVELDELLAMRSHLTLELRTLMVPADERWQRNCIVEIRAAAGGDEAGLFAADLYRMYTHYVERRQWKHEVLSSNPTEVGGFKEIVFLVKGEDAYRYLRFESGVHRVQRVPETEASGRIHTSTATVAVLPEAEEKDVDIDPKDLEVDTFRASGSGGQHVNVTDSAVRITHKPSGLAVSCQDERSQHQNRAKAMRILRARLQELMIAREQAKQGAQRKMQIGSGERSEKIRSYNYPQNRVTDHRIKISLYRLGEILHGDLAEFHNRLLEEEARRYVEAGD